MADPVVIECASACAVTLQLEQSGPFSLSVADGLVLSGMVISLWIVGYIVRAVMSALRSSQDAPS